MSNKSVWLLIDDRAGNRSQVLGVGRALGFPFEIKEIEYTAAAALPNYMLMTSFSAVAQKSRVNLSAPWPDIVIAAGRRTAPVARKIKELNNGKTSLIQIMYPGSFGEDDFDLICVPRHDTMDAAPNRFEITGAPHNVTPQSLEAARIEWKGRFDDMAKPLVALIVGGDTKRKKFTPQMAAELGSHAAKLAAEAGGSLLVTTSRRTSIDAASALTDAIGDVPSFVFKWGDANGKKGDNPYMAYLAMADYVIVTGDSVSMCSEAAGTEKPLYIFSPKKLTSHKHGLLHKDLYASGYARRLEGTEKLESWSHKPLNASFNIAAEIRKRLNLD
ncbi:MAG: mitochondrial fission ELM1 family protein [Rhodospirillaceae bacterium]|nr:mitochondrial fission ELM1 family protein [Rhodospirillaceae bacterium]MCK5546654.1 mitochondrial fission ELM1 family protein [Rhodospirillaceae bacterium]